MTPYVVNLLPVVAVPLPGPATTGAPVSPQARPPQASAPKPSTPMRAYVEDSYGQVISLLPQIALDTVPYLHGAVAGHEGLQAASKAGRALKRGQALGARGTGILAHASRASSTVRAGGSAVGTLTSGVAMAARSSGLVGGAVSLGIHGYKVARGQETLANGGANVAGDLVAASIGGAAGALAASLGTALCGFTGVPLILAGVGLGMAGYLGAELLVRRSALFQRFTRGVYALLSKSPPRA